MPDKITGVCVDIPTVILRAKNERRADYLIELLKSAAPGNITYAPPVGWISVKERLPDEGVTVLVYSKGSYEYFTAEYCPTTFNAWISSFYRFDSDDITHWMPLPEPPKDI